MCLITDSRHLMMQRQLLLSPRGFASVGGSKKEISVRKWKVTIRSAGSSNISQTLFLSADVSQHVHLQCRPTRHTHTTSQNLPRTKKGGQFTDT